MEVYCLGENMKISAVKSYHVAKPLTKRLPNAVYALEQIEHIFVEVFAGEYTGLGMIYCFNSSQAAAARTLIEGYAKLLIGKDVDLIRAHWNAAQTAMGACGQTGLPVSAWAALDMALWDLLGKKANLPVYKMLGAQTDEIAVYASGGWLYPIEELVEEALAFKALGYRHYKMKVGCPDYHDDIKRIEAVRGALGDGVELMLDVNQGWDVKKAVMLSGLLQDMGITYLEEPVHAQDYKGNAEVVRRTGICIVSGESLFTGKDFFELMRNNAADIINPDVMRCGGITEFMQVCALAGAFKIPVTSHTFLEVSAHCVAAAPTGYIAEYIPDWWSGAFLKEPHVVNGRYKLGDEPGLGIALNFDYIKKYGID